MEVIQKLRCLFKNTFDTNSIRHQIELCKDFARKFGIDYILKSNINKLLNKRIISYDYKKNKISKLFEKIFRKRHKSYSKNYTK